MEEIKLYQPVIVTEAILGIITGVAISVPFIRIPALIVIFALSGIFALIQYITQISQEKIMPKEMSVLSAGGGFVCAFCSCIVFVPIALIFDVFGFRNLLDGINVFFLIFFAFFFSLICAMTNIFTGSIFTYIYNLSKK